MFDYHAGDNFLEVEVLDTGLKDVDFTLIEDTAFNSLKSYTSNSNNHPDIDYYFYNKSGSPTSPPGPTDDPVAP